MAQHANHGIMRGGNEKPKPSGWVSKSLGLDVCVDVDIGVGVDVG